MNNGAPITALDGMGATQYALTMASKRLDTIAHNVANVSTTAFKREVTVAQPFAIQLHRATERAEPAGPHIGSDNRPGALIATGNPLDFALDADTFLEVQTPSGIAYTRDGSLHIAADGMLTARNGEPVMGAQGEIRMTNPQARVDKDGKMWDGDTLVGSLSVVHIENLDSLIRTQGGRYLPSESTNATPAEQANIRQGFLEASNVVAMDEMVHMIQTMRSFEFSQKIMQGYDNMLDKAINVLGQG